MTNSYDPSGLSSNPTDNKPAEVQTEVEICTDIDKLIEESEGYRKKFHSDWKEYEAFYDGRHWQDTQRKPKLNFVFSTIEYEVPILTDSRPGTDFIAIEDSHNDSATVLKQAVDFVYDYNHLDMKLAQGVRNALISTNHYLFPDYDPDADGGNGQVTIRGIPWRYVYLDPSAGEDIDDSSYLVIKRPCKIDQLKKLFPTKSDEIEPEDVTIDDMQSSDIYELENRYHGPKRQSSKSDFKPNDMAYLTECWRKDYSMEPIPPEDTQAEIEYELEQIAQGSAPDVSEYTDNKAIIEVLSQKVMEMQQQAQMMQQQQAYMDSQVDPQTGQPLSGFMPPNPAIDETQVMLMLLQDTIQQHQILLEDNPEGLRPKYPNNMRLTIKTGMTIHYDGPVEVDDGGMFPIAPIYAYKIAGQPYSTGEVKNILDPQKISNELFYDEYTGLRLVSNSGWIKDDTSNVDETSLTNDPGIVITKKQGTEVRRLDPGAVSPQLQSKQIQLKEYIQEISGITEVAQGKRPTGISAAAAIQTLQDQAIGRIRLKSRMLEEYTMLKLGKLVAARVIKYWNKRKMLKIYDDSGNIKTVEFNPDHLQDFKYIVRVSPGSTVGLSKEGILNISSKLVTDGIIDGQTFVMMNPDLPGRSTILKRMQEQDQLKQQAQALLQENEVLKAQLAQSGGKTSGAMPQASPTAM